ncbi:MAG TPA: MinD/ParA family protein [Anaerohalosphaeraceae bacterium]|nr:MinD/ParA family protein [Anaerohalosphaeraceae bacterium]HOL87691.1 MinD/ParA family protein [Anaerohalosphaeraceae bacterium]HPP55802.1 MinD/ParA family protein [Anaerohalosphaeraceae bacterium]
MTQIRNEENSRAAVMAVASGKGGVGKTNISLNLAICLAAAGQRIVLIDADLGLGNLDVIMNLNSRYNLSHVIDGRKTLDQITQIGPAGIEVICGGSGLENMANLSPFQHHRLISQFNRLQNRTDMIVIDTGAGIGQNVIGFCMAADHTLVVTTPEPTAITDAYAVIKILAGKKYPGRISLLVNMASSIEEGKKISRQIAQVAARFLATPIYEAGILCRDECLQAAVCMQKPVVLAFPKSPFSRGIRTLSHRLTNTSPMQTSGEGFFRKVVNWFF